MWSLRAPQLDWNYMLLLNVAHIFVSGRCIHRIRDIWTFRSADLPWILPIQEAHVLVSGRSPVVGAILCMLALPVLIGRTKGDRLWVLGKSWSIYLQGDPQDAIDHQDPPTSEEHRPKSSHKCCVFCFFEKEGCFRNWVCPQAYVSWFGGDWPLVSHMSRTA